MLVENHQNNFWEISIIETKCVCFYFNLRVLSFSEFLKLCNEILISYHLSQFSIKFWTLKKLISPQVSLIYEMRQCYAVPYSIPNRSNKIKSVPRFPISVSQTHHTVPFSSWSSRKRLRIILLTYHQIPSWPSSPIYWSFLYFIPDMCLFQILISFNFSSDIE